MRTILLSSLALALVGCSPPAADTGESDQAPQSATASASPPETAAPPPEASPPTPADNGASAVAQAPYNNVPANVSVSVPRSDMHAGTFGLREVARVCGEVPKEHNFAAVPTFIVQLYPDNGPPPRGAGNASADIGTSAAPRPAACSRRTSSSDTAGTSAARAAAASCISARRARMRGEAS